MNDIYKSIEIIDDIRRAMTRVFEQDQIMRAAKQLVERANVEGLGHMLKTHAELNAHIPELLAWAIDKKVSASVEWLLQLPFCDEHNCALNSAVRANNVEVVAPLLAKSRPKTQRSQILIDAVELKRVEIVEQLAKHCNPKAQHSKALQLCYLNSVNAEDRSRMVEALYALSSPEVALRRMGSYGMDQQALKDKIQQEKLRAMVRHETHNASATRRKM